VAIDFHGERGLEPLDYLKIVLRRWPVVVLVTIVAAVIGFATAPKRSVAAAVPHARSYSATYVLALDPTSGSATSGGGITSSAPNLASIAFLTTAGEVPQMAAKAIGYTGSPPALAAQVSVSPNSTVGTLEITATDPSATRATKIADAFATSLMAYLASTAQAAQKATAQRVQATLNDLEAKVASLDAQIANAPRAPNGPPVDVLQAQKQGYVNEYSGLFSQFINSQTSAPAASPLVTFQTATAVPTGYVPPKKSKLPTSRGA